MNRKEVYENIFGAKALFIAGLLIMPALLFNPSTELRVVQFLFFWFLTWLSGKKTNPFITILIILLIVAFNLIIPYGRVLFSAGIFKITAGALEAGIHRAITLEALIMLSKVTIREDLKIPGAFGELLGESLRLFSIIVNRKHRILAGNIIENIDNLLLNLSKEDIPKLPIEKTRTKPAGFAILALAVILSWIPEFLIVF